MGHIFELLGRRFLTMAIACGAVVVTFYVTGVIVPIEGAWGGLQAPILAAEALTAGGILAALCVAIEGISALLRWAARWAMAAVRPKVAMAVK
jgi:hypothetical protein